MTIHHMNDDGVAVNVRDPDGPLFLRLFGLVDEIEQHACTGELMAFCDAIDRLFAAIANVRRVLAVRTALLAVAQNINNT